jgi:hypothetical protein
VVKITRAVGVYCGVCGVAGLGQAVAWPNDSSFKAYHLAHPVIFLLAEPLLIWGAEFCAKLCGEWDGDPDEDEDTSNRQPEEPMQEDSSN